MAHIPQSVLEKQAVIEGLSLRGRGKVRESYDLLGHPNEMLVVASNRCSIFDFVLPALVRLKGEILTAMNHFWVTNVIGEIFETDLVACGSGVDLFLPEGLRGNAELQKQATVVRILPAPDVEDVVRFILTGGGWESYKATQSICGHRFPNGLSDGSRLPFPVYTPTTKAAVGHDEHITADSVAERYGVKRERMSLQVAGLIASYAASRGIILADTKFEFSLSNGKLILADEKGTPDSSRFVDKATWEKLASKGKFPPSLDKQYIRDWGIKAGVKIRDPRKAEDLAFVDSLEVPERVTDMTTSIYRYVFWRLTGKQIEYYQRDILGIAMQTPTRRKIHVVVGSESDLPQIVRGVDSMRVVADVGVSAISCHRNPDELRRFVRDELTTTDVVIAGAGKAAALPGIIKSYLCELGSHVPVIGVALDSENRKDNDAAIYSIECLPGQPVELDADGNAYFGPIGFMKACSAASWDEFLPKAVEHKPAKIHIEGQLGRSYPH